jgi:hypothetical protein
MPSRFDHNGVSDVSVHDAEEDDDGGLVRRDRMKITHRQQLIRRDRHRLAFVNDMHGQKLKRLVANHLVSSVRNIANIDPCLSGRTHDLFSIRKLQGRTFQYIDRFLAGVSMSVNPAARRHLENADYNLLVGARKIASLQLGSIGLSKRRRRQRNEDSGC